MTFFVKLNNLPNFDKLNHHLQGVELGDMAVGYWGNQTGLAYDPMRIKEEELPQSWADMESYIDKNPKNSAILIQTVAAPVMPSFSEL